MIDLRNIKPDETCEPFFLSTVHQAAIGDIVFGFKVPSGCIAVLKEFDAQGNNVGFSKARYRCLIYRGNYQKTPTFPFTGFQEFPDKKMCGDLLGHFELNTLGVPTQPDNMEGWCVNLNGNGIGQNYSKRNTPLVLDSDDWFVKVTSQFAQITYFSLFGWTYRVSS